MLAFGCQEEVFLCSNYSLSCQKLIIIRLKELVRYWSWPIQPLKDNQTERKTLDFWVDQQLLQAFITNYLLIFIRNEQAKLPFEV